MNIENINPEYVGKKKFSPLQANKEPRVLSRRHQMFTLAIVAIETKVSRDVYRSSRDDNEPMVFTVNVTAEAKSSLYGGEPLRCYFRHTLKFTRHWRGYDEFERAETDFVLIEAPRAQVPSNQHFNNISLKIAPGDRIQVTALWEEKAGKFNPYLMLTRVQLCP